jgi:FLVCR family MFS transporter 7
MEPAWVTHWASSSPPESPLLLPGKPAAGFEQYGRRWGMLAIYFLVLTHNCSQWICLAPMVDTVTLYYGCDHFWVYSSILLFDLLSPLSFPCGVFVSRVGCQRSVMLAAALTFTGMWIKALWSTVSGQVAGQVLMAVAHMLGAVGIPVFACVWFPSSQRSLATALLFFATIIGGGSGVLLGPAIVQGDPRRLPLFLTIHAVLGTLCCVPAIFLEAKPPTPPSHSAQMAERHLPAGLASDLRRAAGSKQFLTVLVGFAIGNAVLNGGAITANDLLKDFGYSDMQIGWIGAFTVGSGLLGGLVMSLAVDRWDCHRQALVGSNALAGLALILLACNMSANNFALLSLSISFVGFFGVASFPIAYEVACDVLFPTHEALASGLLTVVAQWLCIGVTALEYYGLSDKRRGPMWGAAFYAIAVAAYLQFDGRMHRREMDKTGGALLPHGPVPQYGGGGGPSDTDAACAEGP